MSINIKDVNKLAFKILLKIFNTKLYWLINFETLFSFIHFLFMLILSLGCVLINLLKKNENTNVIWYKGTGWTISL